MCSRSYFRYLARWLLLALVVFLIRLEGCELTGRTSIAIAITVVSIAVSIRRGGSRCGSRFRESSRLLDRDSRSNRGSLHLSGNTCYD